VAGALPEEHGDLHLAELRRSSEAAAEMNHCRRCDSDYEKPGTCNCFVGKVTVTPFTPTTTTPLVPNTVPWPSAPKPYEWPASPYRAFGTAFSS
jgi:hypothetical protein